MSDLNKREMYSDWYVDPVDGTFKYSSDKIPLEKILTGQELSQPLDSWFGLFPVHGPLSLLEHPWWEEEVLENSVWNNPLWIALLTVDSPSIKTRHIEKMAKANW